MKTNKDLIKTHFPHEFEIQQLYDLQFMQMDSWLKDIKKWIEIRYDVSVMTIIHSVKGLYQHFIIYLKYTHDCLKISTYGDFPFEQRSDTIEKRIAKYLEINEEKIICTVSFYTFESHVKSYLINVKAFEIKDRIKELLSEFNPCLISLGRRIVCVFNSKMQAKEFLTGRKIAIIKNQIFSLLKTYDRFDMLSIDDFVIASDYKERADTILMYERTINDFTDEEFECYEKKILE